MWRKTLWHASLVLLLVTVVSGFAWLVLLGYGEDGMALVAEGIAFIALVIGGTLAAISRIPSTSAEDVPPGPRVVHHTRYERPPPPPPPEVEVVRREVGNGDPPMEELLDRTMGRDLPPMPRGTIVSEEVRTYPTLDRTDMTLEEYHRWTEGFGPLEGQWEDEEVRKRRQRDPDFRYRPGSR